MQTLNLELQKANVNMTNCAIELFAWDNLFQGKDFHNHFCLFNKILLRIFHKFIPNKILLAMFKICLGLMMK